MAAISAANTSLKVALVSPSKHVGGMVAGGLGHTDIGNPSVVGGLASTFFQLVCKAYGKTGSCYDFEPSVAESIFLSMLAAQPTLSLITQQTLTAVGMNGSAVASITTGPTPMVEDGLIPTATGPANVNTAPAAKLSGSHHFRTTPASGVPVTTFTASVFIDATYEGDLIAMAGIPTAWGREGVAQYNESLAGRLFVPNNVGGHQFKVPLNYTYANGTLLPMIYTGDAGVVGQPDEKVQAYNFRMCLTTNSSNRVPIPKPDNYDASYWELFRRFIAATNPTSLSDVMIISPLPHSKTDINNNGAISTDFIGGSWGWPTGTPAQRKAIYQAHVDYTAGFFWFLANDPAVPASLRTQMSSWGLSADEFGDNGNWPYQLYVREGRRMVSDFVFTQRDREFNLTKQDSIGLFSYNIDTHNAQRFPQGTYVRNEGDVEVFGNLGPGQMPYRMIIPPKASATNVLAPVPCSASHIGFGTIRLEPQWMILGQSAGLAAAQAIATTGGVVQDIDVATLQDTLRAAGQLIDMP